MKLFTIACCLCLAAMLQGQPRPAFDFLLNYPNARDFTMSADGKEAYLTLQSLQEDISIMVRIERSGESWTEPVMMPFAGRFRDIEPCLSVDGLRLYFASDRPLSDTGTIARDYDIWYVQRKDGKSAWSTPINPGSPVNTTAGEFYPSLTANGNLYFTSDRNGHTSKDDIYVSNWNDSFSEPVALPSTINSPGLEFNAFIAPDESYLVFSGYNRPDGMGSGDMYISRRNADGTWSESQPMKEANSRWMDYCPYVHLPTNTLYFTSRRSAVQQKHFTSVSQFRDEVIQYENGMSRIYATPFIW